MKRQTLFQLEDEKKKDLEETARDLIKESALGATIDRKSLSQPHGRKESAERKSSEIVGMTLKIREGKDESRKDPGHFDKEHKGNLHGKNLHKVFRKASRLA